MTASFNESVRGGVTAANRPVAVPCAYRDLRRREYYFFGLTRAWYTVEPLWYSTMGMPGHQRRWIMATKTMSLVGSTQNQVPAAPSQKKVPRPSGRLASCGSYSTAQL